LGRCIPHIINIATQAFLGVVSPSNKPTKLKEADIDQVSDYEESSDVEDELGDDDIIVDPEFNATLRIDVLKRLATLLLSSVLLICAGRGGHRPRLLCVYMRSVLYESHVGICNLVVL
jgi:hypothetical protein